MPLRGKDILFCALYAFFLHLLIFSIPLHYIRADEMHPPPPFGLHLRHLRSPDAPGGTGGDRGGPGVQRTGEAPKWCGGMEKISVAVEAAGYRGYLSEAKITCFAEYKRSGRGCIEEKN